MSAMMLRRDHAAARTARCGRGTLWQARIVCLSAFGPYVTGSARTEQIAVFGLLALILISGWPRIVNAGTVPPVPFLVTWGGLYAVMLISTVWRPFDPGFYGAQPVSHSLSALALPGALMVITWYWSLRAGAVALIRAVAPLITGGMSVNTLIELAQVSAGKAAVSGLLPHFWSAPGQAVTVAANAAQNGRYTGIFDQPAEAGIAYGVALLCVIWLARRGVTRLPVTVIAGVLVTAGGVLTLSKVFLLAAIPVAVVTVLRGPARIRAVLVTSASAAVLWAAGSAGMLPAWHLGGVALGSLAHPGSSLASQYTGGRYGSGGTLGPVASDVLHASPWAGFGAGGLNAAYDSLWLEVLAVSGVLGVVLAAVMLVMLASRWLALRASLALPEWHLAGGVLALAAGASLGIPSLTANRAATLLWLILGVLITARSGGPDFHHGRAGLASGNRLAG
jgi:hypothetical protein